MRIILLFLILASCKKEDAVIKDEPIHIVGVWTIQPVGNPSDTFSYFLAASNKYEYSPLLLYPDTNAYPFSPSLDRDGDTTLQNYRLRGKVSDGPFKVSIRNNDIFSVYFRSNSGVISKRSHIKVTGNITDSIPATIY